jgi:glycosyltransferase involved in cell wall biosynthesis
VACTPESGYANPKNFIALSTTDIAGNVAALQALQFAPEENLRQLSIANRELVETKYTWGRLTQTVLDAIERLTSGASS